MATSSFEWRILLTAASAAHTAEVLASALAAAGYTVYDPFGSAFPPAYRRVVRAFIAPPATDWAITLLADFDPGVLPALSHHLLTLDAHIVRAQPDQPQTADLTVWGGGKRIDLPGDLAAALVSVRDGQPIIEGLSTLAAWRTQPRIVGLPAQDESFIPRDALPANAQAMFDGLDRKQAGSMFARMTASLAGKLGGQADAARAALHTPSVQWEDRDAALLAALLTRLCGGSTRWRDPGFVAVRDAYQLHRRRADRPNAALYPGDAEALAAVPDALNYMPVYAGLA